MSVQAIYAADYSGVAGINQVRLLQQDFTLALAKSDWAKIRLLDKTCMALLDRVIAANKDAGNALFLALNELKNLYINMILQCNYELTAIVR